MILKFRNQPLSSQKMSGVSQKMSGQGQKAVPENGPPVGPGATGTGAGGRAD